MIFARLSSWQATAVRLAGLGLIVATLLSGRPQPSADGRGLVVTLLSAATVAAWLLWTWRPHMELGVKPELYVLAGAGGVLVGAAPDSAASAFVFIGAVAAVMRTGLRGGAGVLGLGILAIAAGSLIYDQGALGVLAYALGVLAASLAASNARQSIVRAEQAELLLAQTQRSHEEQLRAARLEESTRIARDVHDVLAHSLAGLAIQLEATSALLEQGAPREELQARIERAHALAREGLNEARHAVGALRGEERGSPGEAVEALVSDYNAGTGGSARLTMDGDPARLGAATRETVRRVAQEALTNVRKHAPGADVTVRLHAGEDAVVLTISDAGGGHGPAPLAASGGGYGLLGMRERATLLGGTLVAGPAGAGWEVELRLPGEGERP
jgi:signal transduction histidine kinase